MSRRATNPAGQAAFRLLGERWTYLLLREIFFGVHRFGALQRNLGIAPNVLSSRLRELVRLGVLERRRYQRDPDWYEYRLSPGGEELVPAIVLISRWGERHLDVPNPQGVLRHRACGLETDPRLACSECGEPMGPADLDWEPAADEPRLARPG